MEIKIGFKIESQVHRDYKKFCRQNGYVMSKRIEKLMRADIKRRLLELPEIKL